MAKIKTVYRCGECGWESPKWMGQCRECQNWGTLEESVALSASKNVANAVNGTSTTEGAVLIGHNIVATNPTVAASPISDIAIDNTVYMPSGIAELDRVLGGGLVPGVVVLLAGEPGVGKSTLLLEMANEIAENPLISGKKPVLYLSGEESVSQIKIRANRIKANSKNLLLAAQTDLEMALGHIYKENPSVVILDSVQTIASAQVDGIAGGISQIKATAQSFINVAKSKNIPIILVGHVNKNGNIAGPRVLEHLVDVVCYFEGDAHTQLRLLRTHKNGYGSTDEVGCFELSERGVKSLEDPSGLFISQTRSSIAGTCVTITLEGKRPLATEVQALVNPAPQGAKRINVGLDYSRVSTIIAVLQARMRINMSNADVYTSTIGGAKTSEPVADLAIALAIASAAKNVKLVDDVVAMGEVTLTGEVRSVTALQQRLNEAKRLGFKTAVVPKWGINDINVPSGMQIKPVANIAQAIMETFEQ